MGCSREKQGQAGQYPTPAEQFLLGGERAPSRCRQPTGGPPVLCQHVPEPAASNPFFFRSWEKGVPGTLYKSKYLCSQGLPSPALYFLPILKCHRSAVFIIVQEMSPLLAGSLTPACAGSAVAASLISAASSCIHPASREDGFGQKGDGTESETWAQRSTTMVAFLPSTAQRNPCSLVHGSDQDPGSPDTVYATSEQTSKPD